MSQPASPSPCPNCGASMVVLRRDRQSVGHRDIVLEWVICVDCRHVRLDHWTFVDEIGTDRINRQQRA